MILKCFYNYITYITYISYISLKYNIKREILIMKSLFGDSFDVSIMGVIIAN